ncbi:MAG: hypothetical protein ACK55I_19485, partial [bacterium]
MAKVYSVTISAKAKNTSLSDATEIVTTAPYSFKLTVCNQKIVLGTTMATMTRNYSISYPGGSALTFVTDYAFFVYF